jgi:hypothetical protein
VTETSWPDQALHGSFGSFAKTQIWRNRLYMRYSFALFAATFCTLISLAGAREIRPMDGNAPIFRVFASDSSAGSNSAPINISGKEPLLVISSVANVQVSNDHKAVRVTLTGPDATRFANITRKHANELLVLEANGKVLEAMRVGGTVPNGVLEFSQPDDSAVVDYLKRRFRLK